VQSGRPAWGWKEPISHLIAPDLIAHFPDARYVHLMRHGLDMAFSQNRRQVRRFGRLLDSDLEKHDVGPQDILRYWIWANRRVVDVVRAADPSRTHIVVFDDLCTAPAGEIARLLEFLEIAVDTGRLNALATSPGRRRPWDGTDHRTSASSTRRSPRGRPPRVQAVGRGAATARGAGSRRF